MSRNFENNNEIDISGFDGLWQVGYQDTQNFIRDKKQNIANKNQAELDLIQKEYEEKSFEIQKLEWQLSEREKELKVLYDELYRIVELNKKLNQQLDDYELLCNKQQQMIQLLGGNNKLVEPILPKFT